MYQTNVSGEENSTNKVFCVPISNANNTEMHAFDPRAPEIKHVQDDKNTCVLISLSSTLFSSNEHVA